MGNEVRKDEVCWLIHMNGDWKGDGDGNRHGKSMRVNVNGELRGGGYVLFFFFCSVDDFADFTSRVGMCVGDELKERADHFAHFIYN